MIELWPMPMVTLDIALVKVTAEEIAERRESLFQAMMARERVVLALELHARGGVVAPREFGYIGPARREERAERVGPAQPRSWRVTW